MKVIIIGDGNSIHMHNYIKVIFNQNSYVELTLFDVTSGVQTNKEAYNYYKENNITLVSNNGFSQIVKNKFIKKIPKIRTMYYIMMLNNKLNRLNEFDYCVIHFVDITKAHLVLKNKKNFKRIIPVFWGSDILRNKKIGNRIYYKLFQMSHKIIFNTENMKRQFKKKFGEKFEDKSDVIKFPTSSFQEINNIKKYNTKDEIRRELKLPNKYIIVCGHSASIAEQHNKLIDAISNCDDDILKKCYFIFPMTYGAVELQQQQEKISNIMKEKGLKGHVLTKYLASEDMLKVLISADIYVSVIETDAFSAVMQESLYSGSFVIYGKWLNYYEIEKYKIKAKSIGHIGEVTNSLKYTIENLEYIKPELLKNQDLILEISSPEVISNYWKEKVFEIE